MIGIENRWEVVRGWLGRASPRLHDPHELSTEREARKRIDGRSERERDRERERSEGQREKERGTKGERKGRNNSWLVQKRVGNKQRLL